ncbi:MAG TPA: hypothetical protein DCP69_10020 [Candidatus Omnitrophica bacterium]|nr:hypothetical protein [Candidatus Omnitrophota bacterium]
MTLLTLAQEQLLRDAIVRVESLRPGLRAVDANGFLDRVVYLCRLRDPAFGRKRNPSGRISVDTLGVLIPQSQPPHFEAISIMRDNPSVNELRVTWLHYVPGPVSDGEHVGPDQEWIEARTVYTDVQWQDATEPPEPTPTPTPTPDDALARIEAKQDAIFTLLQRVFR